MKTPVSSHGLERDIAELLLDTGYDKADLILALARAAPLIHRHKGRQMLADFVDNG